MYNDDIQLLINRGRLSLYLLPWNVTQEPNEGNVRSWLDNLYVKFQPVEQARWNQANIDTLFYAGDQSYVNRHFNFSPGISHQQYYFNLVQQPVNMVTGYQRQHRKSIVYQAADGADPQTTDEYTRLISNCCQKEGINEQYSKSCELSAVAGMNLMQPYLDFTGDDPAQGQLKLRYGNIIHSLLIHISVILICQMHSLFGARNISVI